MSNRTNERRDIHAEITDKLIAAIEANPAEPKMPWARSSTKSLWLPTNALTKKRYNGVNTISLWVTAEVQGYSRPIWGTYRQWVRRVSRMKGVTSWVREQCPALSPHPACRAGNGTV